MTKTFANLTNDGLLNGIIACADRAMHSRPGSKQAQSSMEHARALKQEWETRTGKKCPY